MKSVNPFDLTGKTALVTGSSRGIGRAIALWLGRAGAHVILHGVQLGDALKQTIADAEAEGISCEYVTGDMGDPEVPAKLAVACADKVDILVLNASAQQYMHIHDFADDAFQRMVNTNVRSAFLMLKAFVPAMKSRKWGRIINVGSVNQGRPASRLSVYACTKAALQNLMDTAAKEYAPDGITVNTIVPGIISTDRNRETLADPVKAKALHECVPAFRFGTPDDCAGAVVMLAADCSSYITGASIPIAGGMQL